MKASELMEAEQVNIEMLSRLVGPTLKSLANLYTQHGYELRIVGGAVRDILLKKEPKDIDLASNATAKESMALLADANIRVIFTPTSLKHGTIIAHIDNADYEITTLRVDKKTDGRHAEVEYTRSWKKDALRRDLTYNAMSLDFNGKLYDYFGGLEDLKNNVTKFVGNPETRITEDYIRILRYFRFQGRLGSPSFSDTNVLDLIKKHSKNLQKIVGERIWPEMSKILSGNNVISVLSKMAETNVLKNVGLNNIATGYLKYITQVTNDPILILAALLPNKQEAEKIYAHWKLSNKDQKVINLILNTNGKFVSAADAKKLIALDGLDKDDVMKLLTFQGNHEVISEVKTWTLPAFPINGNDLKIKGITYGIDIGRVLKELKIKWVNSGFELTKDELLELI